METYPDDKYFNAIQEIGLLEYRLQSTQSQLNVYTGKGITTAEHAEWILKVILDNLKVDPYVHNADDTIEHLEAAIASLSSISYGDYDNENFCI